MVLFSACDSRKEIREPLTGTKEYQTYRFSDQPNLVGVKKGDKKVIIPNVYQDVAYMGNKFVCKDKKGFHIVSAENKVILSSPAPFEYNVDDDYFMAKQPSGELLIYLQESGNVINGNFECFKIDTLGNLSVFKDKRYGIVNKDGRELIAPKHEAMRILNGKYVALDAKKDGTSIYDKNQKINWKNVKVTSYSRVGIKEDAAPKLEEVKKLF